MKKRLVILGLSILVAKVGLAQDIHFSQFWNSPNLFNPAATGDFNSDHRLTLQHRDQWRSVTTPYQTSGMSYDNRLFVKKGKSDHWGLGLNLYADKAGDTFMKTTSGNLAFGYHKRLTPENKFSFGIESGFRQHSISFENAQWGSQYNGQQFTPAIESGEAFYSDQFTVFNVSAGTQYAYVPHDMFEMKMGVALQHINRPNMEYSILFRDKSYSKLVAHFGSGIGLKNTNTTILPQAIYMRQGPNSEFVLGSMVRYDFGHNSKYTFWKKEPAIYIGAFYRYRDAALLTFQLDWESWHVGVSYDMNISGLTMASYGRGGFEASITFITPFVSRHYGKRPRV